MKMIECTMAPVVPPPIWDELNHQYQPVKETNWEAFSLTGHLDAIGPEGLVLALRVLIPDGDVNETKRLERAITAWVFSGQPSDITVTWDGKTHRSRIWYRRMVETRTPLREIYIELGYEIDQGWPQIPRISPPGYISRNVWQDHPKLYQSNHVCNCSMCPTRRSF